MNAYKFTYNVHKNMKPHTFMCTVYICIHYNMHRHSYNKYICTKDQELCMPVT